MNSDQSNGLQAVIEEGLPKEYREEMETERQRVQSEILTPRGLDRRKVLIVGGAGYIGSVLTDHFLSAGYGVRSLDNLVYGHDLTVVPFLHHPEYEFVHGDIAKADDINAALDGVTDVVLLAGLVGDPVTKNFPDAAAQANDVGYDVVLAALNGRGLNRVVFVSTCSNYGLIEGDVLADEEFALKPLSLYAESKVAVEKKILDVKDSVDYSPTILRFATAFGISPRMRFDLTVSEFTRAMFLKEDLLVYDADTWRPYCHVQDFANLIHRVLESKRDRIHGEVFNAGGDVNNFTKQMIVDAILQELPDAPVRFQKQGADPRNYRVNFKKVRDRLHFQPKWTVQDGIRELIAAMGQGLFADITVPESFYGNWKPKV